MTSRIRAVVRVLAGFTFVLGIAGCSKGLDRTYVSGQGEDPYRRSLSRVEQEATKEQLEAFNWAVSDLNLQTLHARYPNASPRAVIRGEAGRLLSEIPPAMTRLEQELSAWQPVADQIAQVAVVAVSFKLEKDFFGLQPTIAATFRNNSPHAYSSLGWTAYLYLDDQPNPVAQSNVNVGFEGSGGAGGGLDPGMTASAKMTIGFVSGDTRWTTIEVQRASRHTVKLVPRPQSARDLGGRALVGDSPAQELERLQAVLERARRYEQI